MTAQAIGIRMLVKMALTSKDTKVSSGTTFHSFRHLANPSLSLTNMKLL